jgi:TRAP-type C4-dicarboxylate transport system permease small subunit
LKIFRWLDDNLENVILVILLITIILVMLLQVVMRYFFNNSLAWPEEVCRYCFIWFMFIGFSYSIKLKTELRVDSVVNMMPIKIRIIINKASTIIGFLFTAFLFINSFKTVSNVYITGEYSIAMKIPLYYVFSSAVFGFGLATIRYIQNVRSIFKKEGGVGR